MANVFFTSDLHFGHDNLREFRSSIHGKSFSEISDVDQWLLSNWNSKVRSRDLVWVLGDVAWSKSDLEWIGLCNGRKRLVLGNHDTERKRLTIEDYMEYFESIHGVHKKYGVVMTHVPIHPQELQFRWTHNVHGHIHHKEKDIQDPRYTNVNTDVRSGFPISLDELRSEINEVTSGGI